MPPGFGTAVYKSKARLDRERDGEKTKSEVAESKETELLFFFPLPARLMYYAVDF